VRPLLGGYYAWKEMGFPLVEAVTVDVPVERLGFPTQDIA